MVQRFGNLSDVSRVLDDIATKLDKFVQLKGAFELDSEPYDDIAKSLDWISSTSEKWAKSLEGLVKKKRALLELQKREIAEGVKLNKQLEKQKKDAEFLEKKKKSWAKSTAKEKEELKKIGKGIDDIKKSVEKVNDEYSETLDRLEQLKQSSKETQEKLAKFPSQIKLIGKFVKDSLITGLDKLGTSIAKLHLAVFAEGLRGLEKGISAVYELQERWTKATGLFRTEFGAASAGIGEWTKDASDLEGQMRSLTGVFGYSFKELLEYQRGLGFVDDKTKALRKEFPLIARAVGMTSESVGQLRRTMMLMGQSAQETADFLKNDIVAGARVAGVSSAEFGKVVVENKDLMASFSKTGQKTFTGMITYAKKLGMQFKSLREFMTMTDTFDSTAESMAKMNAVFGTTISSLDMMMEEDPSKRFEMVRDALKGQGKTIENMTRREKEFLAETLKISTEDLNAALQSGETLEGIQKKREVEEKQKIKNERLYKAALASTAETLFSFQLAWDKVTMAINNLISPFTNMLGLSDKVFGKDGKERMTSFSGVMSNIFDKLISFINSIAGNENWQKLMKDLAQDAKDFASWMFDAATGPEAKRGLDVFIEGISGVRESIKWIVQNREYFKTMFGTVAKIAGTIWKYSNWILGAWVSLKAVMLAASSIKFAGGVWASTFGKLPTEIGKGAMSGIGAAFKRFLPSVTSAASSLAGLASKGASATASFLSMETSAMTASKALGGAGLAAAAGLAGYALGTYIEQIKIGEKTVGRHFEDSLHWLSSVVDDVSTQLQKTILVIMGKMNKYFGIGDVTEEVANRTIAALDAAKSLGQGITTTSFQVQKMAESFKAFKEGRASAGDIKRISGEGNDIKTQAAYLHAVSGYTGMSAAEIQGIYGKAKTSATGVPTTSATPVAPSTTVPKTGGGGATSGPMNYAPPAKTSMTTKAGTITLVAGDVYLDSRIVGSHLAQGWTEAEV